MEIRYATMSKTGRRHNNEDAFKVIDMPESNRFVGIVCDGMGGHSFGETASETVCNTISDFWKKHISMPDCDSKVKLACKKASCAIDKKTFELHHAEMGTTMVMVSIENDVATIAHIGDSRCYVQRPGDGYSIRQKTISGLISDGRLCHAVSLPIVQKSLFPTSGSSPFRKETEYYSVLMACTRAWHPTSYKQGCWTTSHWKIYSMYLTFSVKNKVMTTIRQY